MAYYGKQSTNQERSPKMTSEAYKPLDHVSDCLDLPWKAVPIHKVQEGDIIKRGDGSLGKVEFTNFTGNPYVLIIREEDGDVTESPHLPEDVIFVAMVFNPS